MAKKTDAEPTSVNDTQPSVLTPDSSHSAAPATAPAAAPTDVVLEDEVVLTDAEGRRYCRANDCDHIGIVDGYCRFHYLLYWKKIQNRKRILADGKLERYIEELTARYSDKFVELLRKDLRTEKDFMAAIQELELDESASSSTENEEDETKTYIEEVGGMPATDTQDDESY